MAQHQVRVSRDFSLPVEDVYAILSDHNRLSRVLGVPVKRIRDAAGDDVNGVGSVRLIGVAPLGIEETVTAATPNRLIRYKITKGGAPVKNHSGELTFSKTAEGSRVQWAIDFDSSLPVAGTVVRLVLGTAIKLGLRRIS
ncbi:SRPBCC family protein [Solimonas fluminis]|uniref:SRPBCC family protein n=1 Tax=Solimonas fluminis TaxID=2086571 RepID=A0A2S5TKT8_9GAMM|nr:SRPBCC family protein [Solimonas fluminis]PPE75591.1 SRPBCC family protein [Solimonas fluminis]